MSEHRSSAQEIERLTSVYQAYHSSQATQAQWSHDNPGNRAIHDERQRAIGQLLAARGLPALAGQDVLEIGCGSGGVLMSLAELGAEPARLHGIDLVAARIAIARERYPQADFQAGNAEALSFPDASFDLVMLFTVISSIVDPAMARNVAAEAARVLRPGGAVLWYDFRYNSPQNPHVRGVSSAMIRSLFPDFEVQLRLITLLPPLARRLSRATKALYPLLTRLPVLRSHYIGLLTRRAADD